MQARNHHRCWLPLAATLMLAGCGWIELGWGAATFPTTAAGESANVVASTSHAYATQGAAGIEIVELGSPTKRHRFALPGDTSADDLALADGLLFVLDAREPGQLSVYSLADPAAPQLAQPPVPVEVGPFSGVSAAGGLVIVSGGTSRLSLRRYTNDGRLAAEIAAADLGRGQPDVLLSADGGHAFVSVHDDGPNFSLVVLELAQAPLAAREIARLPLDTVGFTPGGARPASFPIEMAIAGDRLLIASAAGLQIVDISHPAAPRVLTTLKTAALPVNVDARPGLAAVVGSDPAPMLTLVDLTQPGAPRVLRSAPLPENSLATGVALAGSQVIVAAHRAGTLVFNLDQPTP